MDYKDDKSISKDVKSLLQEPFSSRQSDVLEHSIFMEPIFGTHDVKHDQIRQLFKSCGG